jgi:cardiolipin synthase
MNVANWISIVRIMLIPFFISTIVYYAPGKDYLRFLALSIFLLAIISDGVDGYIARTKKLQTRLGSFLDPVADKLLLSASFITLTLAYNIPMEIRLPFWVSILVISRDIILAIGSLLVYVLTGDLKITPSILGKMTTFFQMTVIVSVLLQWEFSVVAWDIAAFFTVISCFDYMMKGSKLLNHNACNERSA